MHAGTMTMKQENANTSYTVVARATITTFSRNQTASVNVYRKVRRCFRFKDARIFDQVTDYAFFFFVVIVV